MRATRRLSSFLAPYKTWAILAPLLMLLEVSMDLLQPRLIERIIDEGVATGNMSVVINTGLLQLVVALIGFVGGIGCGVTAVIAGQGFGADVRSALFRKVQSLSFGNLDRLQTGSLITRLTNDVTQVQEIVMMLLRMMVRMPLLLVGSMIMAVITSAQLGIIFVVLVPIVLVAMVIIIRLTFPMFGEVQRRLDRLNTVMQENLAGVRVVKAFARARYEIERFGRANTSLMDQNITAMRMSAVTMPVMMLTLNAGIVAAIWYGGNRVAAGTMQVGALVAFINYLTQSLMSLMMMSMAVVRIARAEASAERIHDVLESTPDIRPVPQPQQLDAPRGKVAFEHVTFGYHGENGDPVLRDISFVAEPGQTVALLGATGAGKSSLVNLIPRFYDVRQGRVTLDGVDVRQIDEGDLRRAVSVALQDTVLFSGTIRDNIRYGKPDASDEEVIAAANMASAHDFISRFPEGYDAIVGQRGVNLSGGQKQRIALARALLTQPAVLVLDDTTSAVDVETEGRIQDALAAQAHTQTRIVVAQRISTVLSADQILVLDDGRIVAQGDHNDLMASSPIYREIYDSQLDSGAIIHE